MTCTSVHIFYHQNQNRLLTYAVAPLVKTLVSKQLITKYFFIRYWVKGPHIRLRLFHECDESLIKATIADYLDDFLFHHPSDLVINHQSLQEQFKHFSSLEGLSPTDTELAANNSYLYIPYQPEFERYGGERGIVYAEEYFQYSSEVTLKLLEQNPQAFNPRLLGLQMMLSACKVFLDDDKSIQQFLSHYVSYWKQFRHHTDDLPMIYENNKSLIRKKVDQLWVNPTSLLKGWSQALSVLHEQISQEHSWYNKPPIEVLLMSYLHMHNNRLGIQPQDESLLAYFITRCLETYNQEIL